MSGRTGAVGAPPRAIALMILTMLIFAVQDALSRVLAENYNVLTVVLLRYWFFAAFVVGWAVIRAGGLGRAAATRRPILQCLRGVLLAGEIAVMVLAFTLLGLVETHAVFAVYPLMIAALAGPVLGEYVGWRRGLAILAGLMGVLVILRPGLQVFSPAALVPLLAAAMFALYGLLTRLAAATDRAETSFFYTGVAGAVAISLVAPFHWMPMDGARDWMLMGALCVLGTLGHFLLIQVYAIAEAGTVQPYAYAQLVFVSAIGFVVFGETVDGWTVIGTLMILGAGLYAMLRERTLQRRC